MATTEGSETEAAASNPLSDGGDTDTGSENSGVDPGPEAKREESSGQKWGRVAALLVAQLFVLAGFSLVYTELGYGATIYRFLATHHSLYYYTIRITGAMVLLLYLLDFRYWAHGAATLIVEVAVGIAFCLSATFVFKSKPHAPVAVFYVGTPAFFCFLHHKVFRSTHLYNYMMSLSMVLLITGTMCTVGTLVWATHGEHGFGASKHKGGFFWGSESKMEFRARLRVCDMSNCSLYQQQLDAGEEITAAAYLCPDVPTTQCEIYGQSGVKCLCRPEDEEKEDSACQVFNEEDPTLYEEHCLAAFMLWACPFIGSGISIVFGVICALLARTVDDTTHSDSTSISPGTKIFIYIMIFGLLGVYTAASIAGASMKAASLVTTFAFLTVAICIVTIGASIGWRAMEQQLDSIPIVAKMQEAGHSDILKAIAIMTMGIPSIGYFFLSFLNQFFRRTLPCTKDVHNEEANLLVTKVGHHQIDVFKHWNWTSVLSKVVGVGFFIFVFNVGVGKFTNLGLSALNASLSDSGLGTVTFVYWVVGFLMFLLPPVPGIPVYLTGGIVLANSAMQAFCDDATEACNADEGSGSLAAEGSSGLTTSFWLGVLYGSMMACVVKACAILAQQKVIGGQMGQKVAVRRIVGVNSLTIRAIKRILEQPGLPANKVAILIGGPDWPTSVLTGILGLEYTQMLIGSSPFVITITVTVLAGALMLKAGESASLGAAASAMLFVASLVQSACLMAAMVAIQDIATKYKDELMAEPPDEEVLASEIIEEKKANAFAKCTHWTVLPKWVKGLLLAEAGLMYISLVLFVGYGPECFEDVEVTTDIDEAPLYGEVMRLVKAPGRIGVAIHFSSVLLHQLVFKRWAMDEVEAVLAQEPAEAKADDSAQGDLASKAAYDPMFDSNGDAGETPDGTMV